jgi:hypothetical protein
MPKPALDLAQGLFRELGFLGSLPDGELFPSPQKPKPPTKPERAHSRQFGE